MGGDDSREGVTLSILDRLTDLEPDSKVEARMSSSEGMRSFKAALCRDLASILNTRRSEDDIDPGYEESANSLLTFGVTDFTSYNLKSSIEQERVRRSIERAIRQFEPRLARVTVTLDEPDPARPVLHFQIEAFLRAGPAAEAVLLDATLHRDSRRIGVSGANP
jgi:type VI secretion system protein ImpF